MQPPLKKKFYIVGSNPQVHRLFCQSGLSPVYEQEEADVIVFIGGHDISPTMYGQSANKNARISISISDDVRDKEVYRASKKDQIKVGICRGAQFLHAMNGGVLYQDVYGHNRGHAVKNTLTDKEFFISSSHHQMMVPNVNGEIILYSTKVATKIVGEYFELLERDYPEFEPEAIWYEKTNSFCYQGHPECALNNSDEHRFFCDFIEKLVA